MRPERLLDRLTRAAEPSIDDPRAAAFTRGLVIGALVGAAIAGSTIWQRRHTREPEPETTPEPAPTSNPG